MQQPGSRAGYQQRFADRMGEPLVAELPVVLHGGHGGGVQREQPVLAELGVAHQQQPAPGVEVFIVEGDGFTAAHAGDRHQADQGFDGGPAQRRLQVLCLGEQRGDVGGGIQVGHCPVGSAGQQAGRRDLGGRVESGEVGGEAADHGDPHPQPARAGADRQRGPGQRIGHGDRACLALLQVGDELVQQPGVAVQLEPQAAPQVQVAGQRLTQPGHDAPGHGRASARSASTLTFVYTAVVCGRRCRRTWPTSASDPPSARMAVAAECRSRCA
jgi:hypothetical protein